MGVNMISNMMKTTVAGTSLEESLKKFTNHSARKTTVSKLKKANVERSDIVKVTGHQSVQSLDDYDEADEEEQRRLSSAISKRNYENPMPVPHTLAGPSMTATKENQFPPSLSGFQAQNFSVNPTMMRCQEQTMINTFNNCQVSFIIGRSKRVPEISKRQPSSFKRRAFIIEDDSD
ncbi:unnamed protein product [Porites lobata]|uniref:Uncharacterized protein n=1 Tax=Porites lobata TaxID=104759 RepID=A0ABN8MXW7_9CNID|nr:unnamed protein product [Porites lobata]